MAITINTTPTTGSSVQDALWHACASDNSGQTDMKYVFDVWIGGVQKIRVKKFPEPADGKGYFDAGPTVRNSMTYSWFEPTSASAYVDQPNISGEVGITYQLRIGEEVSGITTANLASGQVTGYNWAPPLFQRRVITIADKLNKWLTNRPFAYTKLGENLFCGFYTNATLTLKCAKYDYGNNQIGATVTGSATPVPDGFVQMNIGTTALFNTLGITIDSAVKYYDVWFNSLDPIRVYTTCNAKYEPVLIHFLNRWGLWDTQRFDLVSKLMLNVERKGFNQTDYQFNAGAIDYKSSSGRYYGGRVNYSNMGDWVYKLTADAMTDSEYEWMADLMQSPQILLEKDSYFYPVTIKQSDYEYSKTVNNRLRALEIEFELNTKRPTQLR